MKRRGLVPLGLAVGFGVANGVATWGPSLQEEQREKQARVLGQDKDQKSATSEETRAPKGSEEDAMGAYAAERSEVEARLEQKSPWTGLAIWRQSNQKMANKDPAKGETETEASPSS